MPSSHLFSFYHGKKDHIATNKWCKAFLIIKVYQILKYEENQLNPIKLSNLDNLLVCVKNINRKLSIL